jgi:hypothetical protein
MVVYETASHEVAAIRCLRNHGICALGMKAIAFCEIAAGTAQIRSRWFPSFVDGWMSLGIAFPTMAAPQPHVPSSY